MSGSEVRRRAAAGGGPDHRGKSGGWRALMTFAFVGHGLLVGCDTSEKCYFGYQPPRCEGDVLVHCPGGWLGDASWNRRRKDCRLEGKSCRSAGSDRNWTGCVETLGPCDPLTFEPFCAADGEVTCQGSEQWVTPGECQKSQRSTALDSAAPAVPAPNE